MNSVEMQELDALLATEVSPHDEDTSMSFDTGESTDMLLEELEDFDLYESRMKIVNGDLLKFFDNPSLPSTAQRMNMLDQLGETLWYDKWIHERASQLSELEDIDMVSIESSITNQAQNIAKQRVNDIFEKLEMTELPKKGNGQRKMTQ
jgi:phage anti-repressor protein